MLYRKNWGGGILGSQSYLLSNISQFQPSRGGAINHRRFAETILKDFTCRELPVIRIGDVQGVNPTAEFVPWTQVGCMQCHATHDGNSAMTRNYTPTFNFAYIQPHHSSETALFVAKRPFPSDLAQQQGSLRFVEHSSSLYTQGASDPFRVTQNVAPLYWWGYPDQRPIGPFNFRDMNGTLHRESLEDIDELGAKISTLPDFYGCAASRYLQKFTGIKIRLNDPDAYVDLTEVDEEYLAFLRQLTLSFSGSDHQSLRRLLEQILRSDLYKQPDFQLRTIGGDS
jgi:hypothetical protein